MIFSRFLTLLWGVSVFAAWLTFAPEEACAQDRLSVREVQLGVELERGEVVDPTLRFSQGAGRMYAVVYVDNPSRAAARIRVSFEREESSPRPGVALEMPARPRYRTVARTGLRRAPGRYVCVVRTEDGRELARVPYEIVP